MQSLYIYLGIDKEDQIYKISLYLLAHLDTIYHNSLIDQTKGEYNSANNAWHPIDVASAGPTPSILLI